MATIITAKELGRFLKLSEPTIYKLASNGSLPGFRIGSSWRFDFEEVLETIGIDSNEIDFSAFKNPHRPCSV